MHYVPSSANGFQQITGLSTVKALTLGTGARGALVQAEVHDVRYSVDGNPTASVGVLMAVGDSPKYFSGRDLTRLRFIETVASAKLNVTYCY